jgi:SAM-dependent methyltransferase
VLEIGAGSGAVTRRLAKSFPGVRLIAFDIDSRLLALAPDDGCTSRVVGDAMRLPFAEHSVEDVLLRYVVQHLADPVAVFRQVREVLRPGGRLAVVDVDDACWGLAEPYYAEMAGVHRKIAEAQSDAGGSRAVGRRLTRWLRSAGFADVRLRLFVTSTDDHPVDDFAPHLGPSRLSTLVAEGVLSLGELALAAERWRRFRCDPDAWVALVGFLAIGTAPITDPAG